MIKETLGTENNPVRVTMNPPEVKPGRLILMVAVSVLPVAIAILMQRSDLRQAIVMRATHATKAICQRQADFWQTMATRSAQAYNEARL